MTSIRAFLPQAVVLATLAALSAGANESAQERQQRVNALGPVGFWPADEGEGVILHDRSGNDNHGEIFHTPWDVGLLNFTSGFQWAEIPNHSKYQSTAFTIGGWIFSRRESYRRDGMLFIGNSSRGLRLREKGVVEPIGGSKRVESMAAEFAIVTRNEWQQVLYTCEADVGKLYVDGMLVQEQTNVACESDEGSFSIGSDASWWMLHPPESQSLDGTIRDLMLFDRALSPEEVARLHAATQPLVRPGVFAADAIVVDGTEVPLANLSTLSAEGRRRALEQLEKRDAVAVRQMSDALLPILTRALDEWRTRRVAAVLLIKLDRSEARAALLSVLPRFSETLLNEDASREERLACALGLAEMGALARDAIPALVTALEEILQRKGIRLSRIEDLLRNSVMRALLDIDSQDERVRRVLGLALARPVFDSLDLSRPYLAEVRPLVEDGRYMDALDVYRALPPAKHGDLFFSQGDPHRDARQHVHERSYTAVADYDGFTYKLGEGQAYKGVESISKEEFESVLQELATDYPAAREWRPADAPHLYRMKITRTDAHGNERTALLQGDWFVFDGHDAKVRGWSIAIDRNGYLHVTGGQHNVPNPEHYIPGSWEKMGLSRDRENNDFPTKMYWVSREPGSIESFEFVGQHDNPRNIPNVQYLNYMNFVQDNNRELYLYGRINVSGIQSWGLYRYDADAFRWTAVGGHAYEVIESSREKDPGWTDHLIRQVRGSIPTAPGPRTLVWAWQPHFYNYCRANRWGVHFDRTNRMHVQVPIRGLDDRIRVIDSEVYAYSDDAGETFHRADGTKVELPLTVNPAPSHNADIRSDFPDRWWNLWHSLLRHAGY